MEPMDVDESDDDTNPIKEEECPEEKTHFNENGPNAIDLTGDTDDTIDKFLKQEMPEILDLNSIPAAPVQSESSMTSRADNGLKIEQSVSSPWASVMQLVRFRATSEQVADDYMKQSNIKISNRTARPRPFVRSPEAYRQGRKDSTKINVRQHKE